MAPARVANRLGLRAFARAARAPAMRRAYARGLVTLPATPRTGSYLAAHAADLKVSTLQRRLAAISVAHRLAGHRLERKDPAIGAVLAGIKRVKGTRPQTKAPLLTNELRQVLRKSLPDNLTGARDRGGPAHRLRRRAPPLGARPRRRRHRAAGADVVIEAADELGRVREEPPGTVRHRGGGVGTGGVKFLRAFAGRL